MRIFSPQPRRNGPFLSVTHRRPISLIPSIRPFVLVLLDPIITRLLLRVGIHTHARSFFQPQPPSYFIYLGGNQYIEPVQSTAYVIADLEYIQVGPGREAGTRVSS